MELKLTPEPDPGERDALEAAILRLLGESAEPDPGGSAWWRAGVAESLGAETEPD